MQRIRGMVPLRAARAVGIQMLSLAGALLACATMQTTSQAGTLGPYLQVRAGDQSFDVMLVTRDEGKTWLIGEQGEGWSHTSRDEWEITLGGEFNTDPFIAYGIAVVDFGAPTAFGFSFFTPIVPTGPATVVTASLVGGLTDATGDGISITPTVNAPFLQHSYATAPATTMGVDVGLGFAAGAGPPGSFYGYGPFAAGPIPGPVGVWTGLGVDLDFTLSGGGDIAALTGFSSINTVPEPSTIAMTVLGLIGLVGSALRRRRISVP
jgi:hypothetical protein